MSAPAARTVAVWQGRLSLRVLVAGSGPALVYFHGPWGLAWDPFLDALAARFTVHAPEHPGTTPGAPDAIHAVDTLWDLVLCYDEMLEGLGLTTALLAGHSFGAMVACEVAALRPARVPRLALLAPLGLWRDDAPVVNWMLQSLPDQARAVFRDPGSAAARALLGIPDDPEEAALTRTRLTWALGATGKFIWPIPDKGLKKRLHRLAATPALLVWGDGDRLVPRVYADEFARRLPRARLEVVANAGHAPQAEQPEVTARLVADFLEKG
jgi:pimeloyl-ACP methyl ester carboxylesterase